MCLSLYDKIGISNECLSAMTAGELSEVSEIETPLITKVTREDDPELDFDCLLKKWRNSIKK